MIHTQLIAPIGHLVRRQATEYADKVAYWDDNTSVTYGDLAEATANLAGSLQDLGVSSGDAVAILLPNSVPWVESCLAIARAGAISVPISYDAKPDEIAYRLSDAGCRALITTDELGEMASELMAGRSELDKLILVERGQRFPEGERYSALRAARPASGPRDPDDIDRTAFIVYTSGTTGRPKGVLLSERSMLWVTAACWAPIAGLSASDTVLSPLPLFHSYALNLSILSILAVGATEYIMERYSPNGVRRLLESGQFTVMPGVPTMFQYLLEITESASTVQCDSLRLCLSAGAIMPATVNRAFEERFGVKLLDGYGITETSTMVTLNWPHGGRVMGSCGLPVPGLSTRILDPATGRDVERGEEGELVVRGPNVMQGYHNKPEETEKVLPDGWYHTGDLATSDPNGYLTITGRLKELIIRGGQNIAPAEIEEAVMSFGGVLDCAAIGKSHEHLGEVPVVFVTPQTGIEIDASSLMDHCSAHLSNYKVPVEIHVVDTIPRTGSGKVMRFKLRETLEAESETPS